MKLLLSMYILLKLKSANQSVIKMPLIFPDTQTNEGISQTILYLWTRCNAITLHSKIYLMIIVPTQLWRCKLAM